MTRIQPHIKKEHQGFGFLWAVRKDLLNSFTRLVGENGPYLWYKLQGKKILLLSDARGIQYVLQDNFAGYRKSVFYDVLRPQLGTGIFLSEGDAWRKLRRESAPAFANGYFPDMVDQMVGAAESMLARWQPMIEAGQPLDLNRETMWFTLDVVLRALFHEGKENIAPRVQDAIGLLLNEAENRIWAPFSLPQSWVLKRKKYKEAMGFLDDIVQEIVTRRRENKAYPDDLLSMLIDTYNSSPEHVKILRDQMMSFLIAGHETTANGLVWAFYEISKNPDVKERLFAEVDSKLGQQRPTYDIVKTMTYTRQVFDEALRLYPPVWTMSREPYEDSDIPLENGDVLHVPKDSTIMLCAYAVHRREAYWPDAEAFDPTRFTMEAIKSRPSGSYFPFGLGPRLCLGFRFAQIESVIALAMVAQRYNWSLIPGQGIKPEPMITLRPNGTAYFKLAPRKAHAEQAPEQTSEASCPFSNPAA